MSFADLSLNTGQLGSKSVSVTSIPEPITKLIDQAWQDAEIHPDRFFHVTLSTKAERDEFVTFAKAAAKAHDPVLEYRKLWRPPSPENDVTAYFTLRLYVPDAPHPGRPSK